MARPSYKVICYSNPVHRCDLPGWFRQRWRGLREGAKIQCATCGKKYELKWINGYDPEFEWVEVSDG